MRKKIMAIVLALVLAIGMTSMFTGCKQEEHYDLYVAGFKGAYGSKHWTELEKAFEAKTGKAVKMVVESNIEGIIRPQIQAGAGPDVIYCALGRADKLPEGLLANDQLTALDSLLETNITGSTTKLKDIFTADSKSILTTYGNKVLPLFVGLNGIFYDADKFYANNGDATYGAKNAAGQYEMPRTWTEFKALGAALIAEGTNAPALFTYPTAGYMDALIPSSIASSAGLEKLDQVFNYADGIWEDTDVRKVFDELAAIKTYVYKNTLSNEATDGGFKDNQQAVIEGKALFMCNGEWVKGEMIDTTPATFNWGTIPYLGFETTDTRYTSTVYEQVYMPTTAKNKDLAREFLLFLYSNDAQKIIAEHSNAAMLATTNYVANATGKISEGALEGYKGYYDGTTEIVNAYGFKEVIKGTGGIPASTPAWNSIMCEYIKKVWGTENKTANDWVGEIEKLSDIYRPAIKPVA